MNGTKRILIAEDDSGIRRMTQLRLEHEGYAVLVACDGEDALRQVEAGPRVHCILVDVKMPKMNGYQVCQELKRRPGTAKIPVIVFTASENQMKLLAERCIEIGAYDWLRKPFRTKDLLEKIERALAASEEEPRHG